MMTMMMEPQIQQQQQQQQQSPPNHVLMTPPQTLSQPAQTLQQQQQQQPSSSSVAVNAAVTAAAVTAAAVTVSVVVRLTSTTAPGKWFTSRAELQEHYKSDWHRYNLKRREAGLPLLNESDFQARLEAALALRQERNTNTSTTTSTTTTNTNGPSSSSQQQHEQGDGNKKSHLKDKDSKKNQKKKHYKKHYKEVSATVATTTASMTGITTGSGGGAVRVISQAAAYERIVKNKNTNAADVAAENQAPSSLSSPSSSSNNKAVEEKDPADDLVDQTNHDDDEDDNDDHNNNDENNKDTTTTELPLPEIDPCQSLFDSYIAPSVQANVQRMHLLYGFFLPDQEYLIDAEGLIGYAQEKIKLGHTCLYCHKLFRSWQACQQHMIQRRHTKLKYERGIDLDEWDPFYDFTAANEEFYQHYNNNTNTNNNKNTKKTNSNSTTNINKNKNNNDKKKNDDAEKDEEEEWEDVDDEDNDDKDNDKNMEDNDDPNDDEEEEDDDDDDDNNNNVYAAYQDEIAKYGFDVTPLGELVLPDGRIIGHRGLARYYKQRVKLPNHESSSNGMSHAVAAARLAAGERIVHGRVYQLNNHTNHHHHNTSSSSSSSSSSALMMMTTTTTNGMLMMSHPKAMMMGRAGHGILIPSSGTSSTSTSTGFTALSLYRYRAVVRKQRRDDQVGRRLQNKTFQNINRMNKKANRLMNGVSVAHALR